MRPHPQASAPAMTVAISWGVSDSAAHSNNGPCNAESCAKKLSPSENHAGGSLSITERSDVAHYFSYFLHIVLGAPFLVAETRDAIR